MSTTKLKQKIQKEIENINDPQLLEALKVFIDTYFTERKDPLLENWELVLIEKSKKQIANGEYYTKEDSDEIIKRWLKE
jgi:hypothetical protein